MYLESQFASEINYSTNPGNAKCLHQLFEDHVRLTPDNPAIEVDGSTTSYFELDQYANRIAHILKARGVRHGSLVSVYLNKSIHLYAALLGILKAGAGYIPIDPKFPLERVGDIIEDSRAEIVITVGTLSDGLVTVTDTPLLQLDIHVNEIETASSQPLSNNGTGPEPTDICYVIYTSGSTGKPKGVMIEHRNALAFVSSLQTVYRLKSSERVYQGFSVAFDASVEEIWAAFSLGGTLVVPDDSISRSPADTADFINKKQISFFSTIPTFLSMIDADLPSVTTLVLGGEVCTNELVARWMKPQRRILNTYGPTETAVVATWAECKPDEPVTIGTPLPGYEAYILNDDLKPVEIGEEGELYIGGPGVARGYCNRPELTKERFLPNPFKPAEENARLYRTFDLVRPNKKGQIEFIGRNDGQIKIRGFRVELPEIEAVLAEQEAIQVAAVRVYERNGTKDLAAYIIVENGKQIDRSAISENLRSRLPEYMIPKFLDILEQLPLANSGKVDRRSLPKPVEPLLSSDREVVLPENDLEESIREAWLSSLGLENISVLDDFFEDLQGHSLAAAQVTSHLRKKLNIPDLSVRDLYRHRNVRAYAKLIASREKAGNGEITSHDNDEHKTLAQKNWEAVPAWERSLVTAMQALSVILFYGIQATPVAYAAIVGVWVYQGTMELSLAAWLSTALAFAWWPSMLLLSIATKWMVIGKYKPGKYPVGSFYYFRWWFVNLTLKLNWSEVFMGTPLMNLYYRAMGAKIGKNVYLNTNIINCFDLIEIGDNSSIGSETQILGYRVEDGLLIIDQVNVADNCFIGMHCTLGLGSKMKAGSRLGDMSFLADHNTLPENKHMRGTPLVECDVNTPEYSGTPVHWSKNLLFGLLHLALIYAMGYLLIASMIPSIALVVSAFYWSGTVLAMGAMVFAAPIFMGVYVCTLWLVKRLVIGNVKPGTYKLDSVQYLRYWFQDYLLRNTRTILLPVYATIYMPSLLRMLGARIGKNSEVSTITGFTPELLKVGEGSFLADACMVGGGRVHNGAFQIDNTIIGNGTFIGNSALIPSGSTIGNDVLIGVMSTPPQDKESQIKSGRKWLGTPAFSLPNTQGSMCFTAQETVKPTEAMKRQRAAIDALRIISPGMLKMVSFAALIYLIAVMAMLAPLWVTILSVPFLATLTSVWLIKVSAFIKNVICPELKPGTHPLWSRFVWWNEFVNGVYESAAAPAMDPLLGTPFISPALRAFGVKVGSRTYIETTLFSEFDLVRIGDYASLNIGATIQNHLFEDRVFKADKLNIDEGATVANMAVILYGTHMEKGSHLGSLSVMMKGEKLPKYTRWSGVPCETVNSATNTVLPLIDKKIKNRVYLSKEMIFRRLSGKPNHTG